MECFIIGKAKETEFPEETETWLKDTVGLPNYALLLLNLYGVRTIGDLTEVDENTVDEIIGSVRNSTLFCGGLEMDSKSVREQYLGANYTDITKFDFKPMDKKKLLKMSKLAHDQLAQQSRDNLSKKMRKSLASNISNTSSALTSPVGSFSSQIESPDVSLQSQASSEVSSNPSKGSSSALRNNLEK